eukprot:3043002-Pyramimonas_sp.AAC.2
MRDHLLRRLRSGGSIQRALSNRFHAVDRQINSYASPLDRVQSSGLCRLWPSQRHFASQSNVLPDFRFGVAFSQADTLAEAVSEAVGRSLAMLHGAPPHLCQLMVSSNHSNQELAPIFAHECFSFNGNSMPYQIILMGAVGRN